MRWGDGLVTGCAYGVCGVECVSVGWSGGVWDSFRGCEDFWFSFKGVRLVSFKGGEDTFTGGGGDHG